MKKSICICLVLLFLLGVFSSALGGSLDSALDSAFETGKLSLIQAENPQPVPENCEIVLPPVETLEALGFSGISMEDVYATLKQAQLAIASYSPDGTHGVGFLLIDKSMFHVAVTPGRIAMIYPTHERGVEDKYGVLEKQYYRNFMTMNVNAMLGLGDEGMIWSPSGRYCCALDSERFFIQGKNEYCSPILVDTHSGEMFMADSFDTKLIGADAGGWVSGCFSEDEQSFYAMFYGRRFEDRCTFLRYDLSTFSYEVLYGMEVNGRPTLTQLSDGSIFTLEDTYRIGKTAQQLIKIYPDGATETVSIDRMMNVIQEHPFYYKRLYCSAGSGWALMPATLFYQNANDSAAVGLLRLCPENSLSEGAETLWMISAQTMQPEPFSEEQLKEYYASDFDRYWSDKDYLFIFDVKLSPEGRYAAVIAGAPKGRLHDDMIVMLIIRLSDMKALTVEGIDIGKYNSIAIARNQYLLNLSDAGILYMHAGLFQVAP